MTDLERRARRRVPRFAYDFLSGGTGTDVSAGRNRSRLDAVEILPRYGTTGPVDTSVTLFGRRYAGPIGIAPTGNDGVVWPNATVHLASAAAQADVPYIVGTLASASIEETADVCREQLWFQVYGLPRDDHHYTFDLVRRAREAGVQVLVLALDAPVRAVRPHDLRNGLTVPFRPTPRTAWQFATSPAWAWEAVRTGVPLFATVARYAGTDPTLAEVAGFVQRELRGTFTWEEVGEIRRRWDGPLVLKGLLHAEDAARAVAEGADGIIVSNHGGRQTDAAPAPVDVLPGVVETVQDRATVMVDGGIRSGLDVAKVVALGADAAFSGRGFLTALAALGRTGAGSLTHTFLEETTIALAQHGARSVEQTRTWDVRHPTSWRNVAAPTELEGLEGRSRPAAS